MIAAAVLLGFSVLPSSPAVAQSESQESYVVFYIGATSCNPCNRPEVIKAVKEIESDFSDVHDEIPAKYVMVAMDKEIDKGISFLKKYGSFWDEVSVGSFYYNEHVLRYLNSQEPPGVPHVFVFRDTYQDAMHGVDTVEDRTMVKRVMGGEGIVAWVNDGFPLNSTS